MDDMVNFIKRKEQEKIKASVQLYSITLEPRFLEEKNPYYNSVVRDIISSITLLKGVSF